MQGGDQPPAPIPMGADGINRQIRQGRPGRAVLDLRGNAAGTSSEARGKETGKASEIYHPGYLLASKQRPGCPITDTPDRQARLQCKARP